MQAASRLLLILLVLTTVAPPAGAEPRAQMTQVKLGLDFLTTTQQAALWKRVDTLAGYEAILLYCRRPSNIVQRITAAVSDCVLQGDLQTLAKRFRQKISQSSPAAPCEHPAAQDMMRMMHELIDKLVNDAAQSCRACLFC